ncbi:MAG TPA: TIGR02996 domain-containing protein [Gemmataceae bacterium]|nr:TIGR02996 domain-containing protein [Gemmataceae bacterium]
MTPSFDGFRFRLVVFSVAVMGIFAASLPATARQPLGEPVKFDAPTPLPFPVPFGALPFAGPLIWLIVSAASRMARIPRPDENDSREANTPDFPDVPRRADRAAAHRPDPGSDNRRGVGGAADAGEFQLLANAFPRAPVAWDGSAGVFRARPGGLWLRFNRDAELAYVERSALEPMDAAGLIPQTVVLFRAGQLVRIVNGCLPDDGMGYVPTVRAFGAIVHISDATAAVPVQHIPSAQDAVRLFQRSRDEAGFWQAMTLAPEDDLPRLVYADWLDERGDPAGSILRGDTALTLHGWRSFGPAWHRGSRLRVTWRQALEQMRQLFAQPGRRHFEFQPGTAGAALARFAAGPQGGTNGEWQGLSVTVGSAEPVPPFINYLLIHIAFMLLLPAESRDLFRRPRDGDRHTVAA